jgi:hypothetical protein
MFCAISGVVPKEPVVAKTSGLVFEKALVEKVLRVEEKCPVTGAPLRLDDLITIQANKITPPVSSATVGVPGILQALQVLFVTIFFFTRICIWLICVIYRINGTKQCWSHLS